MYSCVFQVINCHQVSRMMNPDTLYTKGWVDVRTDLNFAKLQQEGAILSPPAYLTLWYPTLTN